MKARGGQIRSESGYSLVEVLAAIVILSLAILPMVSMFDAGLRAAVLGGNYDKGRALANANLEEAKARGYTGAEALSGCPSDADGSTPAGFDCDLETETARVDGDEIRTGDGGTMLQVTVTVEWDGGDNDYTTSAIISPGGV